MKLFDKIKSLFKEKEPEKVIVHFSLPDGKRLDIEAVKILDYQQEHKCKVHWDYHGLAVPTNNCNQCWEYYSKKTKR